jgi:multidrug transporter EmrE-like cation transporter
MSPLITIALSAVAAFLFMAATWGMKVLSLSPAWVSLPVVFVLLGLGALIEMEVLRATRLGEVAVLMLALEIIMTFLVAIIILGEQYTLQEILGIGVIVTGMALLSSGMRQGPVAEQGLPGKEARLTRGAPPAPRAEHQLFSTSTPGSALPSIHSRNAPPAVDI